MWFELSISFGSIYQIKSAGKLRIVIGRELFEIWMFFYAIQYNRMNNCVYLLFYAYHILHCRWGFDVNDVWFVHECVSYYVCVSVCLLPYRKIESFQYVCVKQIKFWHFIVNGGCRKIHSLCHAHSSNDALNEHWPQYTTVALSWRRRKYYGSVCVCIKHRVYVFCACVCWPQVKRDALLLHTIRFWFEYSLLLVHFSWQ